MESKVQIGIVQTGTSVWHPPVDERKPATESESSPSEHKEAKRGDSFESGGAPGGRRPSNVDFNF